MKCVNVTLQFKDEYSNEQISDCVEQLVASLEEDIRVWREDDVEFSAFERAVPVDVRTDGNIWPEDE
jgi:hypothetical protein